MNSKPYNCVTFFGLCHMLLSCTHSENYLALLPVITNYTPKLHLFRFMLHVRSLDSFFVFLLSGSDTHKLATLWQYCCHFNAGSMHEKHHLISLFPLWTKKILINVSCFMFVLLWLQRGTHMECHPSFSSSTAIEFLKNLFGLEHILAMFFLYATHRQIDR